MLTFTDFPSEMELALKFIREERCCPPIEVLLAEPSSQPARRHLESCDLCRQKLELGHNGGGFVRIYTESEKSSAPKPGQVWTIRSDRGGWGPGTRWYGTPDVLVLKPIAANGFRVAMVCELEKLSGNNDVFLGEGFAGFAEPWNTFPLLGNDLDICLGTVETEVVEAVLSNEKITTSGDLLMADFRKMEQDTAIYHVMRYLRCYENNIMPQ